MKLLIRFTTVDSCSRMFLNCVLKCFNNLLLSLSLHDEKKICHIILRHAQYFLNRFWHESNYRYFYEFFDFFDTVNTSDCFKNKINLNLALITFTVVH